MCSVQVQTCAASQNGSEQHGSWVTKEASDIRHSPRQGERKAEEYAEAVTELATVVTTYIMS